MKLSIGKRLSLGFGGLLFIVLIFGIYIIVSSQKNKNVSEKIMEIYTPSKALLNKYYNTIDNSKMLIKSWVFIDKIPETPDKLRLVNLHDSVFPALIKELDEIKRNWNEQDNKLAYLITKQVEDTLFAKHKEIIENLNSFEAYDDPEVFLETRFAVEDGGEVIEMTQAILNNLSVLQTRINEQDASANKELSKSYDSFQTYIVVLLILLIITSSITALFTSRSILLPVYKLNGILNSMSKGEINEIENIDTGDEIGQMSLSLNNVVKQLRKTISDIKDSTIFLSNHSKTLTKQASILSNGATEQAASVEEINSSTDEIVASIDASTENSKKAESLVYEFVSDIKSNGSSEIPKELKPKIENTQKLMGNISNALSEHSSEVVGIKKIAVHLKSIAQQNASFSSEMSGNSKNLEAQIEKLVQSVSFFKMNDLVDNNTSPEIETNDSKTDIDEDAGDNFETF